MHKFGIATFAVMMTMAMAAATAQDDAAKAKDAAAEKGTTADALVGTWMLVSVEKGGEKKTGDEVGDQTCVFTKETMSQTLGGMTFAYKFKVDSSKSPSHIDLEITESPFGAGVTSEGIIEVKGDEMKLAYSTDGVRPETFDPDKEGADVRLCVLKRKK